MNDAPISASGCRNTVVYSRTKSEYPHTPHVFVTESGAIGMECDGRLAIKTIEAWIAMAWADVICTR